MTNHIVRSRRPVTGALWIRRGLFERVTAGRGAAWPRKKRRPKNNWQS
ncbi:hypothetical protein J2S04_002684 [Alicyclobacillus tengchongensis]|uniref:Uncharacterized protein n=1 Tax=Alicyclobacillus tolerans TaxID=90970 RepID=A0ABT9LZM8_9BACL|nr:hypothetical protein [Alicyclobacillus tengchongensis]